MKLLVKSIVRSIADILFQLRGLRFPNYIQTRHRIDLLLFGNEQDVANCLKHRLKSGMCVLDVGANVGLITRICAKKVGQSGSVVAFEPDPYTREFLVHNLKSFPNVVISPIALSDDNIKANFHIHPQSGTSNSLVAFEGVEKIVEVDCMTVDAFLAGNPGLIPDCIKIDVEGAELKVLAGMRETFERLPDLFVIIEYCPENLANGDISPSDYYAVLEELRLNVEMLKKDGTSFPINDLNHLNTKLNNNSYCNLICKRSF